MDNHRAREMIADALIPPEDFLLRAAYLLGKDEVLLRFLPIGECEGSPSASPLEHGAPVVDLEQYRHR
jgi:hypothetical protein